MISHLTRRTALQLLAGAAAHAVTSTPAQATTGIPMSQGAIRQLSDLLDLDRSANFGVSSGGSPLNPVTLYSLTTDHSSELSFDISNNQIAASITPHAVVRRACICTGVEALPAHEIKGGVYSTKRLQYGGPWSLELTIDGQPHAASAQAEIGLVENLLPIFTDRMDGLALHRLFFAPVDSRHPDRSPRALVQIVLIENKGSTAHSVAFSEAPSSPSESAEAPSNLTQAACRLVSLAPSRSAAILAPHQRRSVEPGTVEAFSVAWILAEHQQEQEETIHALHSMPVTDWLEATLDARRASYGNLSIPEDTLAAESAIRFSELCRQSSLRDKDGHFSGGFLGSDVDTNQVNWARDSYYSMLVMSLFEPRLCADSIPYFLEWARPSQTTGRGRQRFADAGAVTQSLSNSVSALSLAGAYYRSTADRGYFTSRPAFLESARRILDDVLASRRGDPMLFPSMYFSDGDARGDYHTGSNVAAWAAFTSMARLASEVYGNDRLAQDWSSTAASIRAAIDSHCAGESPAGRRFFEGANVDGSFIPGHDGEESETTLMPLYGYCSADDPRLLRHASLAMTGANPLYSADLDAIWWYNADWSSATFPAWTTALAGAGEQDKLRAGLHRIRTLTDLDGSIWWWPYPYGSKDRARPLRADKARKSAWAAAVYLCRFVHDVLGIGVDVPSNSIRFAPFSPWSRFRWNNARLGAAQFDLSYEKKDGAVSASLVNMNQAPYSATIVLAGNKGSDSTEIHVTGATEKHRIDTTAWGRPAVQVEFTLAPGKSASIVAET